MPKLGRKLYCNRTLKRGFFFKLISWPLPLLRQLQRHFDQWQAAFYIFIFLIYIDQLTSAPSQTATKILWPMAGSFLYFHPFDLYWSVLYPFHLTNRSQLLLVEVGSDHWQAALYIFKFQFTLSIYIGYLISAPIICSVGGSYSDLLKYRYFDRQLSIFSSFGFILICWPLPLSHQTNGSRLFRLCPTNGRQLSMLSSFWFEWLIRCPWPMGVSALMYFDYSRDTCSLSLGGPGTEKHVRSGDASQH